MAASRSAVAVEAPAIGVPPAMETLVLGFGEGAGEVVRDLLGGGFRASEMRGPDADGGGFGVECRDGGPVEGPDAGSGTCSASGLSCRARVSEIRASFCCCALKALLLAM